MGSSLCTSAGALGSVLCLRLGAPRLGAGILCHSMPLRPARLCPGPHGLSSTHWGCYGEVVLFSACFILSRYNRKCGNG